MQEPKHIRYAREYGSQLAEVISGYEQRISEYKQTIRASDTQLRLAAKTLLELSRKVRGLEKELNNICCACLIKRNTAES